MIPESPAILEGDLRGLFAGLGRLVSGYLLALGARVLAADPHIDPVQTDPRVELVPLKQLLALRNSTRKLKIFPTKLVLRQTFTNSIFLALACCFPLNGLRFCRIGCKIFIGVRLYGNGLV